MPLESVSTVLCVSVPSVAENVTGTFGSRTPSVLTTVAGTSSSEVPSAGMYAGTS